MRNLLNASFTLFPDRIDLVDSWDVLEKPDPAARIIYADQAAGHMRRWRSLLIRRKSAPSTILQKLIDSGCRNKWKDSKRPVRDAITYFENHVDLMDYATARKERLPIGSGNVAATCKTRIGVRMKRSGPRWKTTTGEHIVNLRALPPSDRWNDAMHRLHATLRTSVRVAA